MVNEVRSYVSAKTYPKPGANFEYITGSNVDVFANQSTVVSGTAAISGQTITVNGSQNAAVYQQERDGKVIFISSRPSFTVGNFSSDDKLFAVGYDENGVEITIN